MAGGGDPNGTARRHGVVVVEDDDDMALLIRLIVTRDPRLDVLARAATGEEAIDAVTALEPALVILDHGLAGSGLTGLEAAPKLKAASPATRILLFTAYAIELDAALEPAIDAFLRKDNMGSLLAVCQRLTGLAPHP